MFKNVSFVKKIMAVIIAWFVLNVKESGTQNVYKNQIVQD